MPRITTVRGDITPDEFGRALVHEHVLCDFIGADRTGPHRWNPDAVFEAILPNLKAMKAKGFSAFVDCTPAYIGRDVRLLRRLADAADLHIVTNTGFYKEPFLPPRAFSLDADGLADEWTCEYENGIDGTDIRPGFIKIAVNPGPLIEVQKKIVRAAARTSKRTGLTIACHTGHGVVALETIGILREEQLELDRYICVHADSEADRNAHRAIAEAGGWVEYDAIGWRPVEYHVELVAWARQAGIGKRLLLSQDSGWYYAGEPNGGNIRPYTYLQNDFIPSAMAAGIPQEYIETVLTTHAQCAFAYD
jgi:phosphotriesterase-related protein